MNTLIYLEIRHKDSKKKLLAAKKKSWKKDNKRAQNLSPCPRIKMAKCALILSHFNIN